MVNQLKDIRVPLAVVVSIVIFAVGLSMGAVKYIYGQNTKRLNRVEDQNQSQENRLIRLEEKFIASQEKIGAIVKDVEQIKLKQDQAAQDAKAAKENTQAAKENTRKILDKLNQQNR